MNDLFAESLCDVFHFECWARHSGEGDLKMSATATADGSLGTMRAPSKPLMFLEMRAITEFGAFLGALPMLSLAPRGDGH